MSLLSSRRVGDSPRHVDTTRCVLARVFLVIFKCLQSGIDISDELLGLYEDVKLRRKFKYFTFSLTKTGQVGVKATYDWRIDAKADPVSDDKNKEAFAELIKSLPSDDARFVVFDFAETKEDGRQVKKLVLIKW